MPRGSWAEPTYMRNDSTLYGKWLSQRSKCLRCGFPIKHSNPYSKNNKNKLYCKLYHMECEQEIRYVIAKYGQKAYKLLMGELK